MNVQCDPTINDVDKICNPTTGRWVKKTSRLGKDILKEFNKKQPPIIKARIANKTRHLMRIGHNRYSLVPLYQPIKLFEPPEKTKKYCGKNKNIYDLTIYSIANKHSNPYKYDGIDSQFNCLNKGLYLGKQNNM